VLLADGMLSAGSTPAPRASAAVRVCVACTPYGRRILQPAEADNSAANPSGMKQLTARKDGHCSDAWKDRKRPRRIQPPELRDGLRISGLVMSIIIWLISYIDGDRGGGHANLKTDPSIHANHHHNSGRVPGERSGVPGS